MGRFSHGIEDFGSVFCALVLTRERRFGWVVCASVLTREKGCWMGRLAYSVARFFFLLLISLINLYDGFLLSWPIRMLQL